MTALLFSLLCSFRFLGPRIGSSVLGSSPLVVSSTGLLLGSLLVLLLGLILVLSSTLLLVLPALIETPAPVSLSLGWELALLLSIVLGITISKLFRTSRRESTMGIESSFLGLPAGLRSGGYNCVLVINKLVRLP